MMETHATGNTLDVNIDHTVVRDSNLKLYVQILYHM